MRILRLLSAAACLLAASWPAWAAADGHAIAQKNNCLGCHAVSQRLVGPSFKEVAAKYKGSPEAEATLMAKVKNGGQGVWGSIPMPAQSQLSDADLKTVVDWVLAQQ
jgi:cytochrome c